MFQGITHNDKLKDQIAQLSNTSLISATKDDVKNLGSNIDSGFDRVVDAINSLRVQAHQNPIPKTPVEKPPLGPSTVEHIRFTERRTNSTNSAAPYALQVIIQTDATIQPAGFKIECDGEISNGDFFVAGQPAMMSVASGLSNNKRSFLLSFKYPPLTPESPVVVTLQSSSDIHVTKVEHIPPLF